jgi:hypothetical protein
MTLSFRTVLYTFSTLFAIAAPLAAQERWELGVFGGYGFSTDATVTNSIGEASAGIRPGVAFGVFAANEVRPWLSGEVRYTYRQGDTQLASGGTKPRFDAESHAVHYDFVFQSAADSRRSIQPFLAAGAGIRYFRGTGRETSAQPLNRFAVLTKTSEVRPLVSVGGGVKIPVSRLMSVRVEARDYITPFPRELIAPVPGAKVSGWLHDITPMLGLSFTF